MTAAALIRTPSSRRRPGPTVAQGTDAFVPGREVGAGLCRHDETRVIGDVNARTVTLGCTIRAEQSGAHFHAHVELDGDPVLRPGDRVEVHGAPVTLGFGESLELRRTATLTRAGALARAWTRLKAQFSLTELYEVSFSPGRAA